jgi:hypothetical protein
VLTFWFGSWLTVFPLAVTGSRYVQGLARVGYTDALCDHLVDLLDDSLPLFRGLGSLHWVPLEKFRQKSPEVAVFAKKKFVVKKNFQKFSALTDRPISSRKWTAVSLGVDLRLLLSRHWGNLGGVRPGQGLGSPSIW